MHGALDALQQGSCCSLHLLANYAHTKAATCSKMLIALLCSTRNSAHLSLRLNTTPDPSKFVLSQQCVELSQLTAPSMQTLKASKQRHPGPNSCSPPPCATQHNTRILSTVCALRSMYNVSQWPHCHPSFMLCQSWRHLLRSSVSSATT
jgi:hypothetical protein